MTRSRVAAGATAVLLTACGSDPSAGIVSSTIAPTPSSFELPAAEAAGYPEAYVAVVVADPPGDDLAPDGGEHLVIRSNATVRTDLGGWTVEVDGAALPLGIGRQLDVGTELRVHTGPGTDDDDDVFAGLDHEVLDEGGFVVLRDSAGAEVARFAYGASD